MFHLLKQIFFTKMTFIVLAIISLFTAMFIFIYHSTSLNYHQNSDALSILRGNTEKKQVALTFNISWGDKKIPEILSILKKDKVKATFFVSGEWAERHPQILTEIQEQGHELGMLGYRYTNYIDGDLNSMEKDIRFAKHFFHKLGYEKMAYIRTPNYMINKELISLTEKLNLTLVHWSINPYDWKNPGANKIANTVISNSKNGDIILLHASDSAKQTGDALKDIIPSLNQKFHFVTITELMSNVTVEEKILE